jgi:hypothetical protein
MIRMLCSALAVSFLFAGVMHGQDSKIPVPITTKDQIIKSADLQSDAAVLRKAYEALHPGLYRYNTKTEMDAHFAALESKLSHDLSLQDAYLAFSIFAAQVRCGHTYANFFNQRKAVATVLFQGQNRVPFYFRWLDRRMIVTRDFTPDHLLPRGTRVFSINGAPVEVILAQLITVARADGSNDAKRIAYLEVTGDGTFEAFDVYFPMFFPQKSSALQLMIQRPAEPTPRPVSVEALTYEQRIAPITAREAGRKGGGDILFEWKFLSDGTAYLRMPTWALYDSKWDWKAWLNNRLDELAEKNPRALIVDLRGNEGGNDVGNEILKRVVREDLTISSYRRLVRYRATPDDLDPYLDTWDPSFKKWSDAAVELEQPLPTAPPVRYFALKKYDDHTAGNDVIRAEGKPFHGKLYVLIDANNSSATFQFARVVQEHKLGTLIGQPTGGNQRGINGGAFFFLRLPKSQIEMDLPLIATFPTSPQPDAGLTPDVLVEPTLQDIVNGVDAVMSKINELQRN